ncbi:MAG: LamG domain-containing protein [Gammaproteobacteria bacterium]|nr:LamG domain-containing protein [Gammaproteobacteria bacterium]
MFIHTVYIFSARFILSLCIISLLLACGGGGNGSDGNAVTTPCTTNNASDPDTDGDGLSDCFEVSIGTSPADQDSDGDNLTDFNEVVTKAFDPTISNFQFNPRIADVPRISVQLQNVPDFEISFTDSQSTSQTRSHTSGTRTTTTLTNSFTYEQSVGEEVSSSLSSTGGSSGFNVTSNVTYSQNQQETMSWNKTQSRENSTFQENTESETSEQGVTNTGGVLSVLLRVQNQGFQTITLQNLTVTAKQVDPNNPGEQQLISGMDYDTSFGAFPQFDIEGNKESSDLPFTTDLTLGKIYALLRDSKNLTIQPTTWNILDPEGRSYTHNLTNVNARSAQVIIDYDRANGRAIENHYVATVTDFQQNRISAATALSEIIRADYTEGVSSSTYSGTHNGLLSVRDVNNDDAVSGRWVMIHNFLDTDGITRKSITYDSTKGSYSLADIQIAKGEVLHFMYYQDQDGDGLGSREEFLHGTLPNNADSDGDQMSDFEEIKIGWVVPVTQDLTRTVFSDPLENDVDNDGLLDGLERDRGTNPNKRDTDNDGILDSSDGNLSVADMQEVAFLPLSESQIFDNALNAGLSATGVFSHTTDRFGNANAAMNITADADELIVADIFASAPDNGATLVLWIKVDPNLPTNGWSLYEHKEPVNNLARQFFWIYPSGFTVFGDGSDRHSVFTNQNELFTTLPFADWHMLAMVGEEDAVNDGMKTFKVYYNGQLYANVSHPTTLVDFALDAWIFAGASSYNVGLDQYRGAIDDIRFFKRSLDEEEINLLFDAQQP